MLQHVKYQRFFLVLKSWEAAKQRHSCVEEIGMAILIELNQQRKCLGFGKIV